MRVGEITIYNYRQYKGKQEIELETGKENNINIIEGSNGAGKTNLFNAVQWCLYDQEGLHEQDIKTKEENDSLPLINETRLAEMEEGESDKVIVEVLFYDGHNPLYTVRREKVFTKTSEGYMDEESNLIVQKRESGGWDQKDEDKAQEFVYRILPKKIKNFYFFDGERLDDYFRAGTQKSVKAAIKDVSQVDLIIDTIDHLKETERQISRNIEGDVGEKISRIQDKIESKEEDIEKKEKRIQELEGKEAEKQEELKQISDFFSQSDVQEARSLNEERNELEDRLEKLTNKKNEKEEKIKKFIGEKGPLVFAQDAIRSSLEELKDMDEDVGLPPDIEKSFIKALLDSGECICGSDLDEHEDKRKELEEMMEKRPSSEISNLGNKGKFKLEETVNSFSDVKSRCRELASDLRGFEKDIDEIEGRLQEISESLQKIEDYDIKSKEKKREELRSEMQSINTEKVRLENEVKTLKVELDGEEGKPGLRDKVDKLRQEKEVNQDKRHRIEALSRARDLLESVMEEIMNEIREEIEAKTEKQFFDLIWKSSFVEVNIDEDYNIEVWNKHGNNAINDLSLGERQALALSFMAALKRVSGYDAPVLIDTPLGRISEEPRRNIAQELPNYLKDTQVTLLVTNTEYDEEFSDIIEESVGSKHKLESNEDETITEVK